MGYLLLLYFLTAVCRASVVHYCLLENECTRYLHFVPITHITFCCVLVILFLLEHRLWTPNEAFFYWNPQLFGLGETNWAYEFWGNWGIFGQTISTHFVPCPHFSHYLTIISSKQTKPLYPHPKYFYEIGIWILKN